MISSGHIVEIASGPPSHSNDYLLLPLTQYWLPLVTPHIVVISSGHPVEIASGPLSHSNDYLLLPLTQ